MAVCKFCGAPVKIGSVCEYCEQVAESWYYPELKTKEGGSRDIKAPIPTGQEYLVKSEDTLWHIAKRAYGDPLKWKMLAEVNKLKNPNLLLVGQNLYIP